MASDTHSKFQAEMTFHSAAAGTVYHSGFHWNYSAGFPVSCTVCTVISTSLGKLFKHCAERTTRNHRFIKNVTYLGIFIVEQVTLFSFFLSLLQWLMTFERHESIIKIAISDEVFSTVRKKRCTVRAIVLNQSVARF